MVEQQKRLDEYLNRKLMNVRPHRCAVPNGLGGDDNCGPGARLVANQAIKIYTRNGRTRCQNANHLYIGITKSCKAVSSNLTGEPSPGVKLKTMNAFTAKFNAPKDSWEHIKVYFNWNVTEELHTRMYYILNEFDKKEELSEMLEGEGFKRGLAGSVALSIYMSGSDKVTELILSLEKVALLHHVTDFIINNMDDVKANHPERMKLFEDFRQSFFKFISLGAPMPGPIDSIGKMVEAAVRMTPEGSKKMDDRLKKQIDDFQRYPRLHDRAARKKPAALVLFELRNADAKPLGSAQIIFRWFVPAAAHLFLMHFIGKNKPHLYKALGDSEKIDAFEGILQKVEDGQHFDNYRTALFVTSYLAAITLIEICHVISDMKIDSTARKFMDEILTELPTKLPVV